jgi:hypothetical protein
LSESFFHFFVSNLKSIFWQVRKKGSQAGKILRDKANELETALGETKEKYSVEMIRD